MHGRSVADDVAREFAITARSLGHRVSTSKAVYSIGQGPHRIPIPSRINNGKRRNIFEYFTRAYITVNGAHALRKKIDR